MKITITINKLIITHEIVPRDSKTDLLVTHTESIDSITISENGFERQLTEEDGLYDLLDWLQKATHNYISTKLKN